MPGQEYSRIILLVDMDDTMEDLLGAWIKRLNDKHGLKVKPKEVKDWNISLYFPTITKEEAYAPLYDDQFWSTIKPKNGAIKRLKELQDLGFKIYICTTSNYKTIRCKLEFILNRYFPFLSWDQVIITTNKQLINGDILVDDGLHNLIGGNYEKILMTAPHNEDFDTTGTGITRVNSWDDAYSEILRISNLKLQEKKGEL